MMSDAQKSVWLEVFVITFDVVRVKAWDRSAAAGTRPRLVSWVDRGRS